MGFNRFLAHTLLAIVTFALAIVSSNIHAQPLNWSFAENPQPTSAELTEDEITEIGKVEAQNIQSVPGKYCVEVPLAYFQIYNDRYPAFAEIDDEPARYLAWKAHIIARGMSSPSTCIVGDLEIKLLGAMSEAANSGLVYCGKYSRAPQNPQEKRFYDYLNELVGYAELGSLDAISDLIMINSDSPPIMLNTDAEYFLRKVLMQSGEYDWNWDTSHLEPLLDKARSEYISEAVNNHDLNAVLQTTPSCAP